MVLRPKKKQERIPIGSIHYGTVSDASVGYTLKYISKGKTVPSHKNDDRIKEFSLMSKKLGINYLKDNIIKWHKKDLLNRMYVLLLDGKKASMPRYYKERIYTWQEQSNLREHFQNLFYQKELERAMNPNEQMHFRNREAAIIQSFKRQKHLSKQNQTI